MDTQFASHHTQTPPHYDASEQEAVDTDGNQPSRLVRLIAGANLYTIAAIVLVLLRVTNRIDWAWAPVTAPLWVPLLLSAALIAIFTLATVVMNSFDR